ncbi:adenine DNA glycosylase Myh1 [Schizosaccharomyces japonicus yFS275]|uniref:Adenine DNA glycosylase n=1 Tax=Schizosaccharomyces japonicus (strain yFS275 / FY16936) TaxID=402676 RepID=B6K1Z7_SCHJY|nr:adenine DNA glycosylase Myh1 [Schizosaccharomyces japonicus yFS275]EEB07178.1 adenine DNA glycosylase Myh1 [Schizosaccharomyces japonicus yFS275]
MHNNCYHLLSDAEVKSFRKQLLDFYENTKRNLPWRKDPYKPPQKDDPDDRKKLAVQRFYEVLVSEIMLQQTRVETVKRYYDKWMKTLPTILHCAQADYDTEVMPLWSGMGFYGRCKRLHSACKYLAVLPAEEIPTSPERLAKNVPGVGPYTAGAVLSIAWGIPTGVVDGNVQRVLSRLLALHCNVTKGKPNAFVWQMANLLVDPNFPGNFNQALMELGAVTCTPQTFNCPGCPVSNICKAYQEKIAIEQTDNSVRDVEDIICQSHQSISKNTCEICSLCEPDPPYTSAEIWIQSRYPLRPPKVKQRIERAIVVVFQSQNSETDEKYFLIRKRPTGGLLAGLWDLPTVEIGEDPWPKDMQLAFDNALSSWISSENRQYIKKYQSCGRSTHIFTHIHKTSHVFYVLADQKLQVQKEFYWISQSDLEHVGMCELGLKNYRAALELRKRKVSSLKDHRRTLLLPAFSQMKEKAV